MAVFESPYTAGSAEDTKALLMTAVGGLVGGGVTYFINKEANKEKKDSSGNPVKDQNGNIEYEIQLLHDHPYLTGLFVALVGFLLMKLPFLTAYNEDIENVLVGIMAGGAAMAGASLATKMSL